jgi:signal transduction histidine kinase
VSVYKVLMKESLTILIIDDDDIDRMSIKRALKGSGGTYTIDEIASADLALEKITNYEYDCIFLDYLLPGMDGLSLLRKIREVDCYTPIIIITSQGDESIAVTMMKSGASDYLVKTHINPHTITQILRAAVNLQDMYRKKDIAEKALITSEARLSEAQRMAKIGNWEYDFVHEEMYWSNEVFRIFNRDTKSGFPPSLNDFYNFISETDLSIVRTTLTNIKQNESFLFDVKLKTAEIKYVSIHGYCVVDAKTNVKKIIGTIQDITERKKTEEKLVEAQKVAEELMKTKEKFLANMSHEIRTPMNAIIGFTELLNDMSDLPEDQLRYIKAIHTSGQNLMVIINDILDFSKIKSGNLTLENIELNLTSVVDSVIELLRIKAAAKKIDLSYKIMDHVPVWLLGDQVRLNQILVNIVGNAIKFTPENGSVKLTVKSNGSNAKKHFISFEIEDTGIGIPTNNLETIFEKFTQGSDDISRKYGGTGLGLSIVKSLVELQEGTIKVNSKVGEGSTFYIHLPFEIMDQHRQKIKIKSSPKTRKDYTNKLEGLQILLVEDNPINHLLVKNVLEPTGCSLHITENGILALELLKTNGTLYDLILMDIQLPEMDGYEITAHIRNQCAKPLADIPIIAITANAFKSEYQNCINAGMNDYISKPFKVSELYEKIHDLLFLQKSIK